MKENKSKDINKDSDYRKRRGNPHGTDPQKGNKSGRIGSEDNLRDGVSESPKTKQ